MTSTRDQQRPGQPPRDYRSYGSQTCLIKSTQFFFFQTAVMSQLLYGCTMWTLTTCMEKKLDGNYTRMLRAVLNKSWRQHSAKQQLCVYLPPITKTIQIRWTRHKVAILLNTQTKTNHQLSIGFKSADRRGKWIIAALL